MKILKVLHNVFMVPLEQSKAMTSELIQMVFPPSLLVLKDWHNSFEATLKSRWKEHSTLVREIGDCLNVVSCFCCFVSFNRSKQFPRFSLMAPKVKSSRNTPLVSVPANKLPSKC